MCHILQTEIKPSFLITCHNSTVNHHIFQSSKKQHLGINFHSDKDSRVCKFQEKGKPVPEMH